MSDPHNIQDSAGERVLEPGTRRIGRRHSPNPQAEGDWDYVLTPNDAPGRPRPELDMIVTPSGEMRLIYGRVVSSAVSSTIGDSADIQAVTERTNLLMITNPTLQSSTPSRLQELLLSDDDGIYSFDFPFQMLVLTQIIAPSNGNAPGGVATGSGSPRQQQPVAKSPPASTVQDLSRSEGQKQASPGPPASLDKSVNLTHPSTNQQPDPKASPFVPSPKSQSTALPTGPSTSAKAPSSAPSVQPRPSILPDRRALRDPGSPIPVSRGGFTGGLDRSTWASGGDNRAAPDSGSHHNRGGIGRGHGAQDSCLSGRSDTDTSFSNQQIMGQPQDAGAGSFRKYLDGSGWAAAGRGTGRGTAKHGSGKDAAGHHQDQKVLDDDASSGEW